VTAAEQDALAALPPADASARIAELRRTRELMFRAERKAKRLAKIKSKTYRRIAKKARLRAAAENGEAGGEMDLDDMAELDEIDGGSRAREELERREIQRARERATLKHASKGGGGGRWAKSMAGMHGMDGDVHEAMNSRANREEELRRKISGRDEGDESSSNASEDDDEDDDEGDKIRIDAFDEVAAMKNKDMSEKSKSKPTGLMAMKFMQRAADEREKQVDQEVEGFERELRGLVDGEDDAEAPASLGQRVQGNVGRMVFTPNNKVCFFFSGLYISCARY
jgi:U3 small nucleolar RNA-associated protein 14